MMQNPAVDSAAVETGRMNAVHRYHILDTPSDGAFDRVTRIAAAMLKAPIAIVTIVDTDRIWFKSKVGLDVEEIGRAPGLCASAILQPDVWVVEDAIHDPRTLANPLVSGALGLQFYAGAPLRTYDGYNLGTMCVIDREPRAFSPDDQNILEDFAAVVMDELELGRAAREIAAAVAEREALMDDRERQALQLNDDVVQALAVAKWALEVGTGEYVLESLDRALTAAKGILSEMAADSLSVERTNAAVIHP